MQSYTTLLVLLGSLFAAPLAGAQDAPIALLTHGSTWYPEGLVGSPTSHSAGTFTVQLESDGTLAVFQDGSRRLWDGTPLFTSTSASQDFKARLQGDCNLVVKRISDNKTVWKSQSPVSGNTQGCFLALHQQRIVIFQGSVGNPIQTVWSDGLDQDIDGIGGGGPTPTNAPEPSPTPPPQPQPTPQANPTPSPTQAPHSSPPFGADFALRMYWEEGYEWQEDPTETFWCLKCGDSTNSDTPCQANDKVKLRDCRTSPVTKWNFVEFPDRNEIQIKEAGNANLCLTLIGRSDNRIQMKPCNGNEDQNVWFTDGNGAFDGDKFEIHPIEPSDRRDYCVTQKHHPKDGETIRAERCALARKDTTEFWQRW